MELSNDTLHGLNLLNDTNRIPDAIFDPFLQFTAQKLIQHSASSSSSASFDAGDADAGVLKEAGAALSTLLLEAAKHDASSTDLLEALEEGDEFVGGVDDRWEAVGKKYEEIKPKLRQILGSIGRHFPTVTEAGWQLDYVVRDSLVDRRGETRFIVAMSGPTDGPTDGQTEGRTDGQIRFACTVEQLQDLVAKLKNACKGLERIAQS